MWDIFCRVIDNHGDLDVCWRLSCQLAACGYAVRLWVTVKPDSYNCLHVFTHRYSGG